MMALPRDRALVVASEELCAHVAAVLEVAGYQVRAATDGRAARAILTQWRPGVILLDVAAPPPDLRVLAEVLAWDGADGVPLVVFGGPDTGAVPPGLPPAMVVADPLDAPDLLAAVWVATNP